MRYSYLFILALLLIAGCKKPYNPPVISTNANYLVIEGVINAGQDSTIIKLSRTVKLAATNTVNPETNASVSIIGDDNSSYPLVEYKKGFYTIVALNLSNTHMYKLNVVTSNNKTYQSDFVPVKNSPPIDSATYKIESKGVQIYTNTHDPANNTHYYRWEYNETWLFNVPYVSYFMVVHAPFDTVLARPLTKLVYQCWRSDTTSTITIGSSEKLSQDRIANQPITFISSTDEKLEDLYSIQIKQFALTADAYNYWQQLEKNTQQLGSIFDAQPSEIPSNIHCVTDPSEPVIGYISAGIVTTARIFVDSRKLPKWLSVTPYGNCTIGSDLYNDTKSHTNDVADDLYPGYDDPLQAIEPIGTDIILGFSVSTPFCSDCTLRGTNIKPSFWP